MQDNLIKNEFFQAPNTFAPLQGVFSCFTTSKKEFSVSAFCVFKLAKYSRTIYSKKPLNGGKNGFSMLICCFLCITILPSHEKIYFCPYK